MKRYLCVVCLMVAFAGLSSCKKNDDPAPVSPVIGKWEVEKIRYSGFVAPYTNLNGDRPYTKENFTDLFTINSDNTLNGIYTEPTKAPIAYTYTWRLVNNDFFAKNKQGDEEKYTFEMSAQPFKLIASPYAGSDSLVNPTTNKKEFVKYTKQLVYEKK